MPAALADDRARTDVSGARRTLAKRACSPKPSYSILSRIGLEIGAPRASRDHACDVDASGAAPLSKWSLCTYP